MDSKLTILIDENIRECFKEQCKSNGTLASEVIRDFIKSYIKENEYADLDLIDLIRLKRLRNNDLKKINNEIKIKVGGKKNMGNSEGKKVIILDKSMIAQLANDGCMKRTIKGITSKIVEKNRQQYKLTKELPYNEEFIAEKLEISKYPPKNIVPLALYKASGECAELAVLLKLMKDNNTIYTEINDEKTDTVNSYILDDSQIEKIERMLNRNISILNDIEENEDYEKDEELVKKKQLECILKGSKGDIRNKFISIVTKNNIKYVYQMKYLVNKPLDMIRTLIKTPNDIYTQSELEFTAFVPDFIQIIRGEDLETNNLKVLNEKFQVVEYDKSKIGLKIKDVKMSSYGPSFCTEIGTYMLTLNQFLIENDLIDEFQVVCEGEIIEENLGDILDSNINDEIQVLTIPFESIKQSMINLFENKLPTVIEVIDTGNKDKFNNVKMDYYCDTCDYYGNYFAGGIEFLKLNEKENYEGLEIPTRVSKKNMSISDIQGYFDEESNDFCTTVEKCKKSINTISILKAGEKTTLLGQGYNKYDSIDKNNFNSICNENIYLKSDKNIILKSIEVKKEDTKHQLYGLKTANCAKFEQDTLNFYIDAKADTQQIGLSLGVGYEFIEGLENIKQLDDKGLEKKVWKVVPALSGEYFKGNNINIYMIDKKQQEKLRMVEFLVRIDEIIREYERKINIDNKEKNSDRKLKVAIYYWNENAINYIRQLFMDTIKYIIPQGDEIDKEKLRVVYNRSVTKEEQDQCKRVYQRLRGFFTVDKKDQVYVVSNVLFNLQNAIQDLFVFNTNFNNTLYGIHPKLPSWDKNIQSECMKYNKYFKPYKDELHGGVFSQYRKRLKDSSAKDTLKEELRNMMKSRIQAMSVVRGNIRNRYIAISPTISNDMSTRGVECSEFKNGNLLYLFNKIQAFRDKEEKENTHASEQYKKEVLGDCIVLEQELLGKERQDKLNREGLENSSLYKVYKVSKESIFANYDNQDFLLTLYPNDKLEYIYKSFTNNEAMKEFAIYINDNNLFKDITSKFFGNRFNNETNEKLYSYRNILNAEITIKAFNRNQEKPYIVLEIKELAQKIMSYLEESIYDFDFSNQVILEASYKNYWLANLKKCLLELEDNSSAINILENLDINEINQEILSEEIKEIKKEFGDEIEEDKMQAIAASMNLPVSILWGPPGTGKTYTIAKLIEYFILKNTGKNIRIALIGGYDATYNIIDELLHSINKEHFISADVKDEISIKRIVREERYDKEKVNLSDKHLEFVTTADSMGTISALKMDKKFNIITSTPDQVHKFFIKGTKTTKKCKTELLEDLKNNGFDFIIIDEASQMDLAHFIPAILRYKENSKLLLAGDHNQLEPVLAVKLNKADEAIFGSVLKYFKEYYSDKVELITRSLICNRRSNEVIVDTIKKIVDYPIEYRAHIDNKNRYITYKNMCQDDIYDKILDPNKVVSIIKYDDGVNGKINLFEVSEIAKLVRKIWDKGLCIKQDGKVIKEYDNISDLFNFFSKGVGIVITHTAQRVMLQNKLIQEFEEEIIDFVNSNQTTRVEVENIIKSSVDTVEKYQGQEREIMIGSFVVGESELINNEAEFLYNPNRLNVMVSRARAKFILFVSNEMVSNTPTEYDRLKDQEALLKLINLATNTQKIENKEMGKENIELRYKTIE